MSTHPPLQMAYDGQIEGYNKPQQLHSDVQRQDMTTMFIVF